MFVHCTVNEKDKIIWMCVCVLVACDVFASIPVCRVDRECSNALKKSISDDRMWLTSQWSGLSTYNRDVSSGSSILVGRSIKNGPTYGQVGNEINFWIFDHFFSGITIKPTYNWIQINTITLSQQQNKQKQYSYSKNSIRI